MGDDLSGKNDDDLSLNDDPGCPYTLMKLGAYEQDTQHQCNCGNDQNRVLVEENPGDKIRRANNIFNQTVDSFKFVLHGEPPFVIFIYGHSIYGFTHQRLNNTDRGLLPG